MLSGMADRPVRLDIYRTALPMRAFEHAAAKRSAAEAIVVCLHTAGGRVGWGEALPREYVTGETLETVPADLEAIFWPLLRDCRDERQVERAARELPLRQGDRVVTAARCAIELAATQAFRLGLPGLNVPPPAWPAVSGVLGSANPRRTARKLRAMRWYGLRHFKLKLGLGEDVDAANLDAVLRQVGRGLSDGRFTLRVDANLAWPYKEVPDRVAELKRRGVLAVEQPCRLPRPGQFAELAYHCALPLIADESVLTPEDAEVLLGAEGRVWLNVRLGKVGGFGPAARIAGLCARDGAPYVLGCMVGESGILSQAQRVLLSAVEPPRMLEGNYGRFLLRDDLTDPSPRFGYGGRLHPRGPAGLYDPHVRPDRLARYGHRIASLQ